MKPNNVDNTHAHFKIGSTCHRCASGLGEATCRRLAAKGAKVAVVDTNMDRAIEVTSKFASNIPFPPRLGEADEFALTVQQVISNP